MVVLTLNYELNSQKLTVSYYCDSEHIAKCCENGTQAYTFYRAMCIAYVLPLYLVCLSYKRTVHFSTSHAVCSGSRC